MAFVEAPDQPFVVSLSFVDSGVNTTEKSYALQGADLAAAALNANQFVTKYALLTKARIKGYTVSQRFIDDAFAIPTNGAEIENQALITVRLTTSPLKSASLTIPAPVDAIFTGGPGSENYNVVLLTQADLVAWLTSFNVGGDVMLSDGEFMAVGGQLRGRRIHRKSRRG